MVDRAGLPLVAGLTGAARPDATVFAVLVDAIPAVRQAHGRRRKRPQKRHADKGYDVRRCRRCLARRGIGVRIARKGVEDTARLGRHRWVVERTMAWRAHCRRLAIRYARREDFHQALLDRGRALSCFHRLQEAVQ